jgi:hypothetical protein
MKLITLTLFVLTISLNAFAGELKIMKGYSGRGYLSEKEKYIADAKQNLLSKLPTGAQIRSEIDAFAYYCDRQAMRPKCDFVAIASYEDPTQIGPWHYQAKGQGHAVAGEEDDLAIALAKKDARTKARRVCGGDIVNPTDSWKIWKDEVGYTYAANSIQCVD